MDTGWVVSLIVTGIMMFTILAIMIPMDRKYIVGENKKINFKKTTIYLRWNKEKIKGSHKSTLERVLL